MTDYYALLKIPRTATAADIKHAYRRMAVLLHPDKNPHPDAAEGFRAITEAWEILGDPFKKALYDQLLNGEQDVQPVHRDPAYRRRSANSYVPNPDPEKVLLWQLYSYSKWVIRLAVVASMILVTDFFLPANQLLDEIIQDQRTLHHHIMHTSSGREFNVLFPQNKVFHKEPEIIVHVSPVLGILKGIETRSGGFQLSNLPSLYRNFSFMPIGMMGLALFSIFFIRIEGETQFNVAVVLLFLMLLNLIFFAWSIW